MTSKSNGKAARAAKAPKEAKPGPGRPAGSENKDYLDVKHIPPACPKCRSADLRAVRGSTATIKDIIGVDAAGFAYARIRWQRSKCADCGQHITVRTYFPAKDNA